MPARLYNYPASYKEVAMSTSVIYQILEVLVGVPLVLCVGFVIAQYHFSKKRGYKNGVMEQAAALLHYGLGLVEYEHKIGSQGLAEEKVALTDWLFAPTFNFYYKGGKLDRLYIQGFLRSDNIDAPELLAEYDQRASDVLGRERERFAHLFGIDAEIPAAE